MRIAPGVLLCALLLILPIVALAQMYKWVDENGVVNYGDKPPPRVKQVRPFGEGAGSVSVVEGMPKEELERLRERDRQQRLRQLEAEVAELRAREQARENTPPEVVYQEVYVPAYGYGYRRPPSSRPPWSGRPGYRPDHPDHKPRPATRPQPPANPPTALMKR